MRITNKARAGMIAGAALAAMAVAGIAGSTMANAADSSTGSTTSTVAGENAHQKGAHGPDGGKRDHAAEVALTGATADSVKAAVLAKYPGATVDRMVQESNGTSVYEAHVTKADGTKAHVQLDANFVVTGEHVMGAKGGNDGQGGKGGHGHQGGKHGAAPASSGSNA